MDKRPSSEPASESPSKKPRQDDGAQPSTSAIIMFLCHLCTATFTAVENLSRHIKTQHGTQTYACDICTKSFTRKDAVTRHLKIHGPKRTPETYDCTDCSKTFLQKSSLTQHLKTHVILDCAECTKTFMTKAALTQHGKTHKTIPLARAGDPQPSTDPRAPTSATCPPKGCTTALNGSYERHRVDGTDNDIDLLAFLRAQPHATLIRDAVRRKQSIKFFISANVRMMRPKGWIQRGAPRSYPYFTSRCVRVLEVNNVDELLETAYAKIVDSMSKYLREGSGWVISHVEFVDLVISTYKPMKGSSYIPLPKKLANTKSIINVQNQDQKCFLWAVLSALHPAVKHVDRVSKYQPYEDTLNMDNLTFPMTKDSIPKFEKLNGLRINLFGYQDNQVFSLHISESQGKPINLLLVSNDTTQHYCYIKDFNRLMRSATDHRAFFCLYCLHRFSKDSQRR